MGPKLGEILIAGRHLSPGDLKKALDAQLVFGGRLGTNLLDLGLLDEETLTRVLEEQKRVEVATPRMLEEADPRALRMLPSRLAARHEAVPFALTDHEIKVAMIDPTDLIAIDEIAFATGRRVIACIAPEIRIRAYLERHYDIARPVRYVRVSAPDHRPEPTRALPAPGPAAQPAPGAGLTTPVPSIDELLGSGPTSPEPAPARAREGGASARTPAAATPVGDLEDVATRLAEADTREDIGEALMMLARQEFPRAFAWLIQRDRALGWLAHAPGVDPASARGWARKAVLGLGEPSVLADVVASGRYYLGELPARPADEQIATLFGDPRARDVVLLPVLLGGQAVIVLQGDGAGQPLASFDLKSLRAACQKAAQAMEVLLLRSRIRQC